MWVCVSEGVQEWVDGLGWVAATYRQYVFVWMEVKKKNRVSEGPLSFY